MLSSMGGLRQVRNRMGGDGGWKRLGDDEGGVRSLYFFLRKIKVFFLHFFLFKDTLSIFKTKQSVH